MSLPTKEELKREINAAIQGVIDREDFILGKEVELFEGDTARFLDAKHALGLNSGTDAFLISLLALGIGRGDEVITTPFCFVSAAEAIALCGAKPVFVDIEPATCNMDASLLEGAVTENTRAIIPAHMYGLPADLDPILSLARERGISVIEDACQAFGSTYNNRKIGSFGDFTGFSFYPTKTLGSYGDAGLVTTDNYELANKARKIRNHGSSKRYFHDLLGISSRLDTLQAAVLRVQIKYTEERIAHLREMADLYSKLLEEIEEIRLPLEPEGRSHVFTLYTLRTEYRDSLSEYLAGEGISTSIIYPQSIHLQESFKFLGHTRGDFPESEKAQDEVLSLPLNIYSTREEVERIAEKVVDFFRKSKKG